MELKIITHTNDSDHIKPVLDRLTKENLDKKINNYLNKFKKEDSEGTIEITTDRNKKDLFDGKLITNFDGKSFRVSREDYKNLDDLINHLFDHLKEHLSK